MAEDDFDPRMVDVWLANKQLEAIKAYVQAGRRFGTLATNEIKDKWIAAFKTYAASHFRLDHQDRADLECELSIRSEQLPTEAIQEEFETLKRFARHAKQRVDDNPELLDNFQDIADDIEDMKREAQKPKNYSVSGARKALPGSTTALGELSCASLARALAWAPYWLPYSRKSGAFLRRM